MTPRLFAPPSLVACCFSLLVLAGCAARTPIEVPSIVESPLPPAEPRPYTLRTGDTLSVRFWGNEELDQEIQVRPDGKISMPFVDDVQAAGLTPAELDERLTELYASELSRPELTVIVAAEGYPVYVGGEVGGQGIVTLTDRLTLMGAIQESGGFLTTARRREVLVIRTTSSGERVARSVDVLPFLTGEDPSVDFPLAPYDVVFVPRTKIANVNLFVDQYINAIFPLQSLASAGLLREILVTETRTVVEPAPDEEEASQ